VMVIARDLSWDGHEFIAALETKGVWSSLKSKFDPEELATLPFSSVKDVAIKLATELALTHAGLKNAANSPSA
jgi:hypothetical protein